MGCPIGARTRRNQSVPKASVREPTLTVERGMTGGLKNISRYLLASAGVIGVFMAAPEANAQSPQELQQIQTQIQQMQATIQDRKSTRLNSSHLGISYAVFCLK